MYFAAIQSLISSMEEFPIAVRVVGLFIPLWIWVYPLLSSLVRCGHVLSRAVLVLSQPRF
jgi:sorbitol-specific phosphotransferase system component IIBC